MNTILSLSLKAFLIKHNKPFLFQCQIGGISEYFLKLVNVDAEVGKPRLGIDVSEVITV